MTTLAILSILLATGLANVDGKRLTEPSVFSDEYVMDVLRAFLADDKAEKNRVSCGRHEAADCSGCPKDHGAAWCNGDCFWCYQTGKCYIKGKDCVAGESDKPKECKTVTDVGFVIDSSNTLRTDWDKEKEFVKLLAYQFGISKDGSRASVISFSSNSRLDIKFNDTLDRVSFNKAVDDIEIMGYRTHIDRALRLVQSDMFKTKNGARPGIPKVLILLTDGLQTDPATTEDPFAISDEIRKSGGNMIVIGTGVMVSRPHVERLAGTPDRAYYAGNFDELISSPFIKKMTVKACNTSKENKSEPLACNITTDLGFVVDLSGSIQTEVKRENFLVKALVAKFGVSRNGSRASVVSFSHYAKLDIKFNDHFDIKSFNEAVDKISFMGNATRIDLGLRKAQSEMFLSENGARRNTPKIIILITDGRQTDPDKTEDPVNIANELRLSGINIIVIGVGDGIMPAECDALAGGPGRSLDASNADELMDGKFIKELAVKTCNVSKHNESVFPICKAATNVGFILDASRSVKYHYQKEKNFIKVLAAQFGITENGSRASVVTFSYYAELSIPFKQHTDIGSFNKAVDDIRLLDYTTRIDLALRKTQSEMFKSANGMNPKNPNVLILLTDGIQTDPDKHEDPADVAKELRNAGIEIIAVGIGYYIDRGQLLRYAGREDKVFTAANFDELIASDFLKELSERTCEVNEKEDKEKKPHRISEENCWSKCGNKGGYCPTFCGKGGYCCRTGHDGCSIAMQAAAVSWLHICVAY